MGTRHYVSPLRAPELIEELLAASSQIVTVAGAPRSGKSRLALALFTSAAHADLVRQGQARLIVSHRAKANSLNNQVIQAVGRSRLSRPVQTLSALGFEMVRRYRQRAGLTPPKLLNGAEQGAVIRSVLAGHVAHAQRGDDESCATCRLIKTYFALARTGEDGLTAGDDPTGAAVTNRAEASSTPVRTTAEAFSAMLTSAFADQLRDMFSRLSELHFGVDSTAQLGRLEAQFAVPARQRVEWDLAFALRAEYAHRLERSYPGQYRLDSAYALVEAEGCVRRSQEQAGLEQAGLGEDIGLPRLVVVDDSQDLTLAGHSFLLALVDAGAKLVLIGADDESVQGFRGAYPEVISQLLATDTSHRVAALELEPVAAATPSTYARTVAARVSQSIGSVVPSDSPIPDRPGKLPLPDGPSSGLGLDGDDSLNVHLFRTPAAELDHLVWQLRSLRLGIGQVRDSEGAVGGGPVGAAESGFGGAAEETAPLEETARSRPAWSDMAVIAHDNATLRAVGQRCEREGIPVVYSSVSKPLKEEPVVQGLLALLELADLVTAVKQGHRLTEAELALLRSRVRTASLSPLFTGRGDSARADPATGTISSPGQRPGQRAQPSPRADEPSTGLARPVRLERVQTAVESLKALRGVLTGSAVDGDGRSDPSFDEATRPVSSLYRLLDSDWQRLAGPSAPVDWLSLEAVYAFELCAQPETVIALETTLDSMLAHGRRDGREGVTTGHGRPGRGKRGPVLHSKDLRVLHALADVVRSAAAQTEPDDSVEVKLWRVWSACGLAAAWQRMALESSYRGRLANSRLDAVMRLFSHAQAESAAGGAASDQAMGSSDGAGIETVGQFVRRVEALEIEADSLAKVAPKTDSVVLTTPAGVAGSAFEYVWVLGLQRGAWPNLAPRNTLFGSEVLAAAVFSAMLKRPGDLLEPGSQRLAVLYSELKSLLVALTRARVRTSLSAVVSEDSAPSEFLTGLMPELVGPDGGQALPDDQAEDRLTGSLRGLVGLARGRLAQARLGSAAASVGQDAAEALAYLARAGVAEADPDSWMFLGPVGSATEAGQSSLSAGPSEGTDYCDRPINLSPSSVDAIWACPLRWSLQRRFGGPQGSSAATSFGSLIHAVAEHASRQGWDRDARLGFEAVRDNMLAHYQTLRAGQSPAERPTEIFDAPLQDQRARTAIANIARYFVDSRAAAYSAVGGKGQPTALGPAGALADVQVERSFSATFGLEDIIALARRTDGLSQVGRAELVAALAGLVGGFAEGFDPAGQPISLRGRIDRLERRTAPGPAAGEAGKLHVIDYKTGKKHTAKAIFSDLQLVCYQLGLDFGQLDPDETPVTAVTPVTPVTAAVIEDGPGASDRGDLADLPIERSMLFDVEQQQSPAEDSGNPEINYQPALVRSGAFNGHFAARSLTGSGKARLSSLFDLPPAVQDIAAGLSRVPEAPESPGRSEWPERSGRLERSGEEAEAEAARRLGEPSRSGPTADRPALPQQQGLAADATQAALARLVTAAGADGQLLWCLTMVARVLYAASYSVADQVVAKRGPACVYCAFKAVCPLWPRDSANLYDQAATALAQEAHRD